MIQPALALLLAAYGQEPCIQGLLLLGREEAVVQEGAPEFQGLKIRDVPLPSTFEELQTELIPLFQNQPLTDDKLVTLQRKIITYFRERNRPLTVVDIPLQDVTNGVVQLVVTESKLGKVQSTGNRWFSDRLLEGYIRIKPGQPIDTENLLEDVSWMNQNPFHFTNVIYTPGEYAGTTDLELATKDRFPLRVYGGGDNTGLEFTGTARWFTGFDWANVWGLDHILSCQGTASTDFHRFRAITFHYTAPLPWHHTFIAYGGYSKVLPEGEPFLSIGKNTQVSLRYQMPIHRSYHPKLQDLSFGLDVKNNDDSISFTGGVGTERFVKLVNITQAMAGYGYEQEFGNHEVTINLLGFACPGEIIAHQTDEDFESQHPKAKNRYLYTRCTFAWKYQMPHRFGLYTQLRFQLATTNLVPTEEFGLGGYDTVRGYRERELNVDRGMCFNLEIRSPPISLFRIFDKNRVRDALTILAFLDYGVGGSVHPVRGEPDSRYLASFGPGLRYTINTQVSIRFDYGFKMHRLPDHTHGGQGHVGAILSF